MIASSDVVVGLFALGGAVVGALATAVGGAWVQDRGSRAEGRRLWRDTSTAAIADIRSFLADVDPAIVGMGVKAGDWEAASREVERMEVLWAERRPTFMRLIFGHPDERVRRAADKVLTSVRRVLNGSGHLVLDRGRASEYEWDRRDKRQEDYEKAVADLDALVALVHEKGYGRR